MARAGSNSEVRTRRRLLWRITPHLKEEAMSRPQATVRRVGRRPTAIPNSEFCLTSLLPQTNEFSTANGGGEKFPPDSDAKVSMQTIFGQ